MQSKALSFIAAFLLLFVVYLIASASISAMDLILGSIASAILALLTSTILIEKNSQKAFNVVRWAWAVFYFFYYFLVAEVRAHLDVIKRILHPRMPINPGIVRVPYTLESDYGKTAVACSITNTPGTVVVDISEGEEKRYYVHWINVKSTDERACYEAISESFEKYLRRVFD
jgi:multicomponent Na+:H+ antiporter subunit E